MSQRQSLCKKEKEISQRLGKEVLNYFMFSYLKISTWSIIEWCDKICVCVCVKTSLPISNIYLCPIHQLILFKLNYNKISQYS